MRVSMGGGYGGMVGGGSSGGMGMMEDPTLWGKILAFLDTLPVWLSTIIIAAVVILGAMFIGWLAGQIIGRIIYPNPDKPSVLNKKEKMIYAGALSAAIILVVVMAIPKSDEDMAVNGGIDGTGGVNGGMDIVGDANGVGQKEGVLDGVDGANSADTDENTTGDSSSSEGSTDSSSDTSSSSSSSSESESSSSSSSSTASGSTGGGTTNAPASPAPAPNIAVKPVPSVG